MSTTTTINPSKDTYVWERNTSTNYGTGVDLRIGDNFPTATQAYNTVMEFDVSGYDDPSAIVSANLTLTHISDFGSVNNTATIRRLGIDFVESGGDGCTWDKPDDGEATTWGGGEDYAETNVPDVSFSVGVDGDDVTVDISGFVIDAIQRRAGVLRLVFFMPTDATAQGWTKFASTRHGTSGNHPALEIIVAARVPWSCTLGGDLDNVNNWTSLPPPDANDFAYFIGDKPNITSGSLDCHSIFIGKTFTGNFGTSSSSITMDCYKMLYSSPYSEANLTVNDAKGYDATVRINNSNNKPSTVKFTGETAYRLVNTGAPIELTGTDIEAVECHSARASFTSAATITTVNITGGGCRLQNGAGTIYAVNASLLVENSSFNTTDITQSGGYVRLKADTVADLIMYAGTMTVRGNEGAPITIANLSVYPVAIADLRTKSNTIETTNPVTMYGGRVLLDGNVNAAVT